MKLLDTSVLFRKDNSAINTIEYIKSILHNYNIPVHIVQEVQNGDSLFSCRLQIEGTHCGTNGKGVKEEYSLASAYGEFMERLQTGFLFSVGTKTGDVNFLSSEFRTGTAQEVISCVKNLFPAMYDLESDEILVEMMEKLPKYLQYEPFYDIEKKSKVYLPISFINSFCGSNGLCAGNTPYEAINQGMCEVFERMAIKRLYTNTQKFPTIPKEYYKDLNSMELINYLENKKYFCIIKDLTLGGRIPVVGFILIDPSRTKCRLSVGSDINFDIALHRCITESFQGRKIDLLMPSTMNLIRDIEAIDTTDIWELKKGRIADEIMKQFVSGDGLLPLRFLSESETFTQTSISVFNNGALTNEDEYKILLDIAFKNNLKVFVKDYSFMKFPTYRVFIPNESFLFLSMNDLCRKILNSELLRRELRSEQGIDYNKLYDIIHATNTLGKVDADFDLNNIMGNFLLEPGLSDTHLIEIILLIKLKRFSEATTLYLNFFSKKSDKDDIALYICSLANNSENKLIAFYKSIGNKKAISNIEQFQKSIDNFDSIICTNCESCVKKNSCKSKEMAELKSKLSALRADYHEDYLSL